MPTEPTRPRVVGQLTLRPATPTELPGIAELYLAARLAAVPMMPPGIHPPDDVRRWVESWDLVRREVWIAETSESLLGFADVQNDWLESLYVEPQHTGQGVGAALLDLVKTLRPNGFCLWVFESNTGARRFYRDHGLVELEHTDGSANEERSPDLRMAWPGADPLGFLRTLIDEVDDQLALLLARRAAITAVQRLKAVPERAGRDLDREREIAVRMADQAPSLGLDRIARIVHTIITESLDALE
jgi:GNAT superfamily N-acetyltransferase/chorismate mutase